MVPLENSAHLALSFLFQRLKWPVPMSRWRAAKGIRKLLDDPSTRSAATDALLGYLQECGTESEVCEVLTIVFLTSSAGRPSHTALTSRIHCPSLLADVILERTYGWGHRIGGWDQAHSGDSPIDLNSDNYFEEHKTAHVPPVFVNRFRKLEGISGYPFVQHWFYEWKMLRDRLGTHFTRYPHYFDDVLDARAGIKGQYWQRMREVYLSAYLRTLAYAVSKWSLPQRIAEDYCLDMVHGIAGLFDVDPGARPAWLIDFPEKICAPFADLSTLVCELTQAPRADGMVLVSLDTPVAASVQEYAKLTISAHLVTPDYELAEGDYLYEQLMFLPIAETFELKGPLEKISIQEAKTEGKRGDEVAVCNSLFPRPFGCWQGDYMSLGLTVPAAYVAPNSEIRCTPEGIECITSDDAKVVSRTRMWNDNWTPSYPSGGTTRCGTATVIDQGVLDQAKERLGRKLSFFVRLRTWDREKDYGEYSESERIFFLSD